MIQYSKLCCFGLPGDSFVTPSNFNGFLSRQVLSAPVPKWKPGNNDRFEFHQFQAGLTANFAFSIHKLNFALFPLMTLLIPTLTDPEELT
ncbi:hypothetical protein SAMN05216412_105121 [Nitrosospira multiformis]|uniref:Uncharacterized protein n=1 Tax=Nitrosospira multiformis TaxID=1231 RepID=A0A1I0DST1_9PROT|nr:hypothetical protein SAMN05216412_105121 [Nitrosospira multiformis]